MIDFRAGAPVTGSLDVRWHAGHPSPETDPAPAIQVHSYSEHTLILRQNKSVHFEAPFLFLLFGNDRAPAGHRMPTFCGTAPVTRVLGCHIEMTRTVPED
ncbi:hypothetical protein ACWD01_03015 [Streptomyces sp. NPDC002835]